jgi:hypothetical protein
MVLDFGWMVGLAAAFVGVGILLRFLPAPDETEDGT